MPSRLFTDNDEQVRFDYLKGIICFVPGLCKMLFLLIIHLVRSFVRFQGSSIVCYSSSIFKWCPGRFAVQHCVQVFLHFRLKVGPERLSNSTLPALLLSCPSKPHIFYSSRSHRFSEWLTFPIKYRDLDTRSRLVFTVWDVSTPPLSSSSSSSSLTLTSAPAAPPTQTYSQPMAVPVGGTSMLLFNKRGLLKLGFRKLLLWPEKEGDGAVNSTTPHKTGSSALGLEKVCCKLGRRVSFFSFPPNYFHHFYSLLHTSSPISPDYWQV
jgi:hypothetical protein